MSCFIVSDKHISAIVRYAKDNRLWVDGNKKEGYTHDANREDQACNLLYVANVRSFNERYDEDNAIIPGGFDESAPQLPAIEAIKACQSLAYQCDNWEGFEGSQAQRFLDAVTRHAITQLPGYDAAPWSIE